MIQRILTITLNSFKEMYRDRYFLVLIFGVMVFFCLSLLLGQLSFEEHKRILFDLGISSIHWLNLGLCLFIGGTSIRKELERQTYMTLLASPLSRFEFLLGKFFGILFVSMVSTLLLGGGLWVLLNSPDSLRHFIAILAGIMLESAVLLALAILMSLVLSPFVGLFTCFSIFLIGHWLDSLKHFAVQSKNQTYIQFAELLDWIFPNLYRLNWRNSVALETGVPISVGLFGILHALAWVGLLLWLSSTIFKRKNLI